MVKNRYFSKIIQLAVVMALISMFMAACANNSAATEETEEKAETAEIVVKTKLSFIVDEEFDAAMTEIQALYSKENNIIEFTKNEYSIPEEVLQEKNDNALSVTPPNDAKDEEEKESVADLFLMSSREEMDEIEELGLIEQHSRFDMLTSELVIVAKADSSITRVEWDEIVSEGYHLALGNEAMPEGNAARQALSTIGAFVDPSAKVGPDILGTEGQYQGIEPTVCSSKEEFSVLLKEGEADLAVMFSDDAVAQELKVVGTVSAGTYRFPLYPAAMSADSQYLEEVEAFLAWATSDEKALKIWQKHGLLFPG